MWYSCIGKRLGKKWRAYYIEIMAIKLKLYILSICSGIWPLLSYVLVENIFASFSYYMNYIQWMSMYKKYRSKKARSCNKTQLSNLMIAIVYIRNSSWNSLRSKKIWIDMSSTRIYICNIFHTVIKTWHNMPIRRINMRFKK